MVIRATDRVSSVIAANEGVIDVFVALSPAFERLRNPAMRRVMSRLVTVEQAARMAGVGADELVARLNAFISGNAATVDAALAASRGPAEADAAPVVVSADGKVVQADEVNANVREMMPAALAAIPAAHVVHLDVRAELRAGREPFSMIMAALRTVPPGGALAVRATFEPVPLYAVMKRQGLENWTEQLGDEDWRVWFHPGVADPGVPSPAAAQVEADGDVVVIDVRGLEPPEPMVRTLAALDALPPGGTLVQINVRVPQFLLPLLEQRGYTYEVREQEPDLVRLFITRSEA